MQDYSILRNNILDDISKDKKLNSEARTLKSKLDNKSATYKDAATYSKKLGDSMAKGIADNIQGGIPDDELVEFAEACLVPVYTQSQKTMLGICEEIQQGYNEKAGIGLNPVKVAVDNDRTYNLRNRFEKATSFDEVAFLTGENVCRSITRGAVQDSIKENAEFQKESGIDIVISRTEDGNCCDWCASVCGTFNSIKDLPKDFWKIHRNCTCVIDYHVGNTNAKIQFKTQNDNLIKETSPAEKEYIDLFEKVVGRKPKADEMNYSIDDLDTYLLTGEFPKKPIERELELEKETPKRKTVEDLTVDKSILYEDVTNKNGEVIEFDFSKASDKNINKAEANQAVIMDLASKYNTNLSKLEIDGSIREASGVTDIMGDIKMKSYRTEDWVHEFAHSLTSQDRVSSGFADENEKAFEKSLAKLFSEYKLTVHGNPKDHIPAQPEKIITSYSMSHKDEFMAEGFSLYYSKVYNYDFDFDKKFNQEKDMEYAKKVVELIDKHFKK